MKVSQSALEELNKLLSQSDNPQAGIRIFSQQGCCGPGIQMALAEKTSAGDKVVSIDKIDFFVEETAEEMLNGVTIEFQNQGFRLEGFKSNNNCC